MPEVTRKQQFWKDSDGRVTEKESEVVGTWDMPLQAAPSRTLPNEKPKSPVVAPKVASLLDAFGWEEKVAAVETNSIDAELETMFKEASGVEPDTNISSSHKEQPPGLPQNKKVLVPHVDVTSHDPPKVVKEKTAEHYAMPSIQCYPLDGFHQVKEASSYFDRHWKEMEPEDRREFASNLVKRASALSIPVSETADHYGAPGYAPRLHTLTELAAREDLLKEAEHQSLYDELKDQLGVLPPDVFARALHEIDKYAGIEASYDRDCMDPWFTTFGTEKTARPATEADTANPKDAVVLGAEYMSVPSLVEFAKARQPMVAMRFGDEFAKALQSDPTGIFDSLPRDQKLILMRMVNNSKSATQGASTS
mgnify:CR=1 FL=1